jgi:hypothetical protein
MRAEHQPGQSMEQAVEAFVQVLLRALAQSSFPGSRPLYLWTVRESPRGQERTSLK